MLFGSVNTFLDQCTQCPPYVFRRYNSDFEGKARPDTRGQGDDQGWPNESQEKVSSLHVHANAQIISL